ncbi:MAG TPA: hypothetical protein VMV72_06415 [Verrucomicrobiae bacterium]|nr:hypothetical protein [Verrucomicrobiae bacterium]
MDPIDELKQSIKEAVNNLATAQRALQAARMGEAEKEWLKQQLDTATRQVTSLNNGVAHFSPKR